MRKRNVFCLLFASGISILIVLVFVHYHSRDLWAKKLDGIQIGMTEEEVQAILGPPSLRKLYSAPTEGSMPSLAVLEMKWDDPSNGTLVVDLHSSDYPSRTLKVCGARPEPEAKTIDWVVLWLKSWRKK